MAKRGRKKKFNNPYKVDNEKANEIRSLNNSELISRTAMEYKNWMASIDLKKNDAGLALLKEQISNINEEIEENPEYVKALEEFERIKEELVSEELARLKEEKKNLLQPYNEDTKTFKGLFQLSMDELNERRSKGLITVE